MVASPPLVALTQQMIQQPPERAGPTFATRPRSPVRPGLESVGLAVDDTRAVLKHLAGGSSIHGVARAIAQGNLLRKRSLNGRKHIVSAVRRRFLDAPPSLPPLSQLSACIEAVRAPRARAQLLLPYLLLTDRAAHEVCTTVVIPHMARRGELSRGDVVEALAAVLATNAHQSWGDAMRTRWAQGLLSVLREVGVIGRGARRQLFEAYSVHAEPFAFHLRGVYDAGLRGTSLVESPFWQSLLLTPAQVRSLLTDVADRGWWRVRSVAGTLEAVPVHRSLMEWLADALG